MSKKNNTREDRLIFTGEVIDVQRNKFTVQLTEGGSTVLCELSGKMRKINKIFVVLHDQVEIEVSPMDLTRGRIISRLSEGRNRQQR